MAVAVSAACPPNLTGRVGLSFYFFEYFNIKTRAQMQPVRTAEDARRGASRNLTGQQGNIPLCAACSDLLSLRGKANEVRDEIFVAFGAPPLAWTSCTRRCEFRAT